MALFDQLTPLQLGCFMVLLVAVAWLFLLDPLWGMAQRRRLHRRLAREFAEQTALLETRPCLALRVDGDGGAADVPALPEGDGRLGLADADDEEARRGTHARSNGQPYRGGDQA